MTLTIPLNEKYNPNKDRLIAVFVHKIYFKYISSQKLMLILIGFKLILLNIKILLMLILILSIMIVITSEI
jgi:hypothetical protein